MSNLVRIGTRGSRLSVEQTGHVVEALRTLSPETQFEVQTISSSGDDNPDAPLEGLGIGVFTNSIEQALRENRIDLAIHSLKDLPTIETPGLVVVPVMEREDPRDALVNRWSKDLIDLPEGARIGTSSPRRIAQLKHGRKDVLFIPIRGNIETRLQKAEGADYDGIILAAAGVRRLGLEGNVTEYLSPHVCAPAPGQGALAMQCRADDSEFLALARGLAHAPTVAAVVAEREVLRAAGSGCQLPIGAYGEVEGDVLKLFATVTAIDGSMNYRVQVTGTTEDPDVAGKAAYAQLLEQGAGDLMHGVAP
jgi:hydroxymethylbilane synthase